MDWRLVEILYFSTINRVNLGRTLLKPITMATTTNSPPIQRGHVQVIYGPMFSGKSTELLRRIRRYTIGNKRCIVVKYANDIRTEKCDALTLVTHDKAAYSAVSCDKDNLSKLLLRQLVDAFDVVGIDEGQFVSDVIHPFTT